MKVHRYHVSANPAAGATDGPGGGRDMVLKMQTDYALRTLIYLAHVGGQASANEIAEAYGISRDHLLKVIQPARRRASPSPPPTGPPPPAATTSRCRPASCRST